LNLDVKQQEKLKQLLPSKKQQELPRRQRRKENKPRRKMGEQKQKMDEKMNAILTPNKRLNGSKSGANERENAAQTYQNKVMQAWNNKKCPK
jgi:hypothetical protein